MRKCGKQNKLQKKEDDKEKGQQLKKERGET
jgi:hypothetical protein